MTPIVEIRVPVENVNDEWATVVALHAANGSPVRRNEPVATIETTKIAVELTAPEQGIFHSLAAEGERVPVGAVLGLIAPDTQAIEAYLEARDAGAPPRPGGTVPEAWPEGVTFSRKARELIAARGLPPSRFAGLKLVREGDVLAAIRDAERRPVVEVPHPALRGVDLNNVSLPAGLGEDSRGRLDPAFLEQILADPSGFGSRPAEEKLDLYRRHGAAIGDGVRLGTGVFLAAPYLVLDDGAEIGAGGDIRCRERLVMGPLSRIGPGCRASCVIAAFGMNVYAGKGIEIGGGGNRDPWAVLSVGDLAYLGDDLFLNTCRPIVIGREAFLTQRSIVITHNIGHSVLDGFENRFAPVVLEDGAQVGMNCTVYAGARIGRFAVLGSNSYAVTSIPAETMAFGVPARAAGTARKPVDPVRQATLVRTMLAELGELLRLKGVPVAAFESRDGVDGLVVETGGAERVLEFHEALPRTLPGRGGATAERVVLVLRDAGAVEGAAVIDLLGKHVHGDGAILLETVREFLRKRGIRCTPLPWRYRGGLI